VETSIITTPPSILSQPDDQTNNVGTDVTFNVVGDGTPTLQYQWRKDVSDITDATNASLTLNNVQESDQGVYSVVVSNAFGSVTSSPALLIVNQAPVADASATATLVSPPNGVHATVILDGSRSSDSDGDPLQYLWLSTLNAQPSTVLATGAVAVVQLPVGVHPILLVVSDGLASATNAITVEVITPAQAVQRLIAHVESSWRRSQPLLATLSAALRSIERGNSVSAINQLQAFHQKVRAQVAPSDPTLAASYIQMAQEIIEVLSGGNSNPAGRPHGRLTATRHQAKGPVQLQFAAAREAVCIVEASTNLVNWEKIGVAREHSDGMFVFDDPNAATFPNRFYRIASLGNIDAAAPAHTRQRSQRRLREKISFSSFGLLPDDR
jgi:hypothetical protein